MGYLRRATHPRIFDDPMTPRAAIDNVARPMELPRCRMVVETEDFLNTCRHLAAEVTARGSLVPDVHPATLMRVHDVRTLYTHDRDFLKLPFLKVVDPVDRA